MPCTNTHTRTQLEIELFEQEKLSIQKLLPKVLHELGKLRDSLDVKKREMNVYDRAIEEIESNYGHILYSPKFYSSET